jgi:hypothetical protein
VGTDYLSDSQVPSQLGLQTTLVLSCEAKWRKYGLPELKLNLAKMLDDESAHGLSKELSEFGDSGF